MRAQNRRRGSVLAIAVAIAAIPAVAVAAHFTDVDPGDVHAPGIGYLEATGITAGCTATTFCPSDGLTRAQMGTFLHRASGNAPGTDPSVNAAALDGEGPSAYTTSVHVATLAGGSLAGADSSANAVVTGTIANLPAGEYVVTGQIHAQNGPSARLICRTVVGGSEVARAIGRVGSDPGQSQQLALPVTAHAVVAAGTADLELRCHAENLGGAAPSISVNNGLSQLLAMRVGDAP